ncbi:ABC transporter ATP-binding protein [Variovorax sp. LjRoot290]|uniref:ABC transporter ATP-binding protein n=1 Tax=unclassified Variovorax TaxID=663243 RepID=UPI00088AD1A7|nr:ABC transporter ATP-binding protein [Variovorax sp. CF079]SDE58981.1 putative spermidine/putrescine transport system ATP-binding protein [Variovorax sp. CF079]
MPSNHQTSGHSPLGLSIRPERQGKDVALSGIRKVYKDVVALPEVSLAVERGEFCTLLGASGSGKTTLLKIIAGFEAPDAGSVRIAGRDVTRMPIAERNIGMVFQNYALFPHMSVFDNVSFALRMRRLNPHDIRRRVAEALELVSMGPLSDRLPRELSGGQQQRAALARALVFTPDILLMDEPLGALDKNLRQAIQLQLKKLHHDLGLTVVFVTHDQDEAMNLSDRIVIMDQGRIVQTGAPETLYRAPDSAFVAGFLGECNFIDQTSRTLAVRPENVRLGAQLGADDIRHEGRVLTSTFCGLHWKVFIESLGRTVVAYAPAGVTGADRTPGQSVAWGFRATDAMEFAAA